MKQISNDLFFLWVENEIAEGRAVRFRLKGHSMFPLLRNGKDDVILYPYKKEELAPMDVVLFKYHNKHLLHRIIRREGNHLLMQGDGSFIAKEECTIDNVIGKVGTIVRLPDKMISVDSWQWKLASLLWNKTGILKTFLIRILRHLI